MDYEKENEPSDKPLPRRSRRRSSILRESPSRNPLESMEVNLKKRRRSLKRVSFADTNTIKEFIKMHGGNTEWNSSYETPCPVDSSSSTSGDLTVDPNKSVFEKDDPGCPAAGTSTMEITTCDVDKGEDENEKDASMFIQQFMALTPCTPGTSGGSVPAQEEPVMSPEDDTASPYKFLSNFLNLTASAAPQSGDTQTDQTQRIPDNMELTTAVSQIARLTQDDQTQRVGDNMELTTAVSQIARLTQNDQTQRIPDNMELTIAASQVTKLTRDDQTQRIPDNMELTTAVSQMTKLTQDDQTQRVTDNMELTTAASQMTKLTQDVTQRVSDKMELTTAASQMTRLTQDDQTLSVTDNMELTTAASQMTKLTQDATQRVTDNMELTTAASQINKLPQVDRNEKVVESDELNKDNEADQTLLMELTTTGDQLATQLQSDPTQNMDLTTVGSETGNENQDNIEQNAEAPENQDNMGQHAEAHVLGYVGKMLQSLNRRLTLGPESALSKVPVQLSSTRKSLPAGLPLFQSMVDNSHIDASETQDVDNNQHQATDTVNEHVSTEALGSQESHAPLRTNDQLSPKRADVNYPSSSNTSPHVSISRKRSVLPDTANQPSLTDIVQDEETSSLSPQIKDNRKRSSSPDSANQPSPKRFVQRDQMSEHSSMPHISPLLTLQKNYDQASLMECTNIPAKSMTHEELLDDVDLSLVDDSMNDSTSDVSTPTSSGTTQWERRKSIASEGLTEVMPLISSFMERVTLLDSSRLDITACEHKDEVNESHQGLIQSENNVSLTEPCTNNEAPSVSCSSSAVDISIEMPAVPESVSGEQEKVAVPLISSTSPPPPPPPPQSNSHTSPEKQPVTCALNLSTLSVDQQTSEEYEAEDESATLNISTDMEASFSDKQASPGPRVKEDNQREAATTSSDLKLSPLTEPEPQQCEGYCSLSSGAFFSVKRGGHWSVVSSEKESLVLQLACSPLKVTLTVSTCGQHSIISTATCNLNAQKVTTECGRMVLSVLGCRLAAGVAELSGMPVCEVDPGLVKIWNAYQDNVDLMLELQLLAATHTVKYTHDSVSVCLSSVEAHVSVSVVVRLEPPHPEPHCPYTLTPSAVVHIGNLRKQTVEEVLAGVGVGRRHVLRLVNAVDSFIHKLAR